MTASRPNLCRSVSSRAPRALASRSRTVGAQRPALLRSVMPDACVTVHPAESRSAYRTSAVTRRRYTSAPTRSRCHLKGNWDQVGPMSGTCPEEPQNQSDHTRHTPKVLLLACQLTATGTLGDRVELRIWITYRRTPSLPKSPADVRPTLSNTVHQFPRSTSGGHH